MSRFVVPPTLLLAPLLWLFRRALFGGEMFVYRDAAHYYFPLYHYVQSRWASGGLPLWNPLDGIGQPLLGDPTAAVLYPGKLLFLLPFGFATCFVLYVVGHLWLAGCGTYVLARRWRVHWQGALLGGLAYEMSGQVLFQYCNPIYCVGAAWLPWAVLFLDRTLITGDRRAAVFLGVVLSLMTLGGDPQAAYHLVLMGLFLILLLTRRDRKYAVSTRAWAARRRVALLTVACLVALMLSAVQVLPSLQWSRQSDRVLRERPRTVYEWMADASQALGHERSLPPATGLWERAYGDRHAARVDDFSVGPWRWVELLWPNVSGQQFPIHRRWTKGIPAEGRVWTPSLYMGLVPLMLLICRARFLQGTVRLRWLSWLAVISIVAALGTYGLAWFAEEIRFHVQGAAFQPSRLAPRCGGLYWLMTVTLPSYMYFRYPAKLWTIAALVMSLLAAKGWSSHIMGRSRPVMSRRLCWFALISLLLGTLTLCGREAFANITHAVPADAIFGPFDTTSSWRDVVGAFLHGAVAAGMAAWSIYASRTTRRAPRWVGLLVWLLCAMEMTAAQSWLIQTAPGAPWRLEEPMEVARTRKEAIPQHSTPHSDFPQKGERFKDEVISSPAPSHEDGRVYRCSAWRGRPPQWKMTSSWDRQTTGQRWDYQTMLPKYHLLLGHGSLATVAPFSSADYHLVWEVAAGSEPKRVDGARIPQLSVLNLLGANSLFVPPDDYALTVWQPDDSSTKRITSGLPVRTQSVTRFLNPNAFPRAWIVHDWEQWGVIPRWTRKALWERTDAVLFPHGTPRDFTATAIVEGGALDSTEQTDGRQSTAELCRVLGDWADSVELNVKLDRAGIVVLGDQYFPGWRVDVAAKNSDDYQRRALLRVNRVMRGVHLERGEYSIRFCYEPPLLRIGLFLSAATWMLLVVWVWVVQRRGRQLHWSLIRVRPDPH